MIVAIDGPAGAGKSTVSLRVAEALGFRLVSTGALYRAVALLGRERGTAWDDAVGLAAIGREVGAEFRIVDGDNRVLIDGEDRSEALRVPEISQGASIVSAHPEVRRALQREAAKQRCVCGGRCGSSVRVRSLVDVGEEQGGPGGARGLARRAEDGAQGPSSHVVREMAA